MSKLPRSVPSMLLIALLANSGIASQETIGPNGINSLGLVDANGQPLTGVGIGIGQVEHSRAGLRGFDTNANSNSTITPAGVVTRDMPATANDHVLPDENATGEAQHAERVAGVMISNATAIPLLPSTPTGVAPGAKLYSGAFHPSADPHAEAAITSQYVGTQNGGDIRATNLSFVLGTMAPTNQDGNSLLTLFVDWSASHDDTLYVASAVQIPPPPYLPFPTDHFNGITVASSSRDGSGVFRSVSPFNEYSLDADSARTSVSLLAPGDNINVTGLNDAPGVVSGTSYSAPHATGTVALLQQYADERISASAFGPNARRHEVMKAVLMNSADKLIDNGTVMAPGDMNPVPTGSLLGMQRTVLKQDGTSNWFDSPAYDDSYPEGAGVSIPLDLQMGAGHLNAARALQQFQSGEFNSDGARVPVIGWDYGNTDGITPIPDRNHYVFNQQLLGGSFIAITLAWDRDVSLDMDGGTPNRYDIGDTFTESTDVFGMAEDQINDLDLYLAPYNGMGTMDPIAYSFSPGNVEHLFFRIPTTGEYEFWVEQADQEQDLPLGQDYAVAWWVVGTGPLIAADFDDNGDVDARDIDILWSIVRETGFDPNDDDNPDLNGDDLVNEDDVDFMLAGQLTAGTNRVYGDANLSGGSPELTDYNRWRTGTGGWAGGDFDGSGGTPELNDYNLWRTGPSQFPGTIGEHGGGAGAAGLVPEPATIVLLALGLPALLVTARSRKRPSR